MLDRLWDLQKKGGEQIATLQSGDSELGSVEPESEIEITWLTYIGKI